MRQIDADELVKWLLSPTGFLTNCEDCNMYGEECVNCIVAEAINNAPTVDPCPKCGAKMDK